MSQTQKSKLGNKILKINQNTPSFVRLWFCLGPAICLFETLLIILCEPNTTKFWGKKKYTTVIKIILKSIIIEKKGRE